MAFKINISEKSGKTFKLESESEELNGKEVGETIEGKEVSPDLNGYQFEIKGASDKSGFPSFEEAEGVALKRILLGYGKGMHKRPKGDKKINRKPRGLRLRKTVRGKVISPAISQVNLKVVKEGSKKLSEIFPDQNKPKEPANSEKEGEQKAEVPAQ